METILVVGAWAGLAVVCGLSKRAMSECEEALKSAQSQLRTSEKKMRELTLVLDISAGFERLECDGPDKFGVN